MKLAAIGQQTYNFKSVMETKRVKAEKMPPEHTIVEKNSRKVLNPVSTSGWIGVGALATTVISGIKHMPKTHKTAAFISVGAIATHIGLVSSRHHFLKLQNDKKEQ